MPGGKQAITVGNEASHPRLAVIAVARPRTGTEERSRDLPQARPVPTLDGRLDRGQATDGATIGSGDRHQPRASSNSGEATDQMRVERQVKAERDRIIIDRPIKKVDTREAAPREDCDVLGGRAANHA